MTWTDVHARLAASGGCCRRAQLVRTRSDARSLTLAAVEGRVRRAGRGLYALPGASDEVVRARMLGGRLTCVSALTTYGVPLLVEPRAPHVALERRRGARSGPREGAVVHWAHCPAGVDDAVTDVVVPPVVALVHAVSCLPVREAVAAVDAVLRLRLVREAQLREARPARGLAAFDEVMRLVDAGAGSLPESLVRVGLVAAGLRVRSQVRIDGVGRVDLLVEGCVVVEVDGYAFHSDRRAFAEDRRRDRAARLAGFTVLRFTYEDAVHRTDELVAEVLRHCPQRPHP